MKYYTYRLQKSIAEQLPQTKSIPIDFLPPDCANASDGDKLVVYISESLEILGLYHIENNTLIMDTKIENKTLRDVWTSFDFVIEVTPTTSRLFKKKMREISQSEFENLFK